MPMHTQCTPPQRLAPTFRDDRNPRARTWHAAFRKSVSATDERSTGTTTSRINPNTRATKPSSALRPFSTTDEHSDSQVGRSS